LRRKKEGKVRKENDQMDKGKMFKYFFFKKTTQAKLVNIIVKVILTPKLSNE
jgi:hypothetical protein